MMISISLISLAVNSSLHSHGPSQSHVSPSVSCLAGQAACGQLSPVYNFRNIRTTFPSGMKNDLRPSFGLMLFLIRPKFSAISRRGSNFVSCPIRSSRKLNSRARKN